MAEDCKIGGRQRTKGVISVEWQMTQGLEGCWNVTSVVEDPLSETLW